MKEEKKGRKESYEERDIKRERRKTRKIKETKKGRKEKIRKTIN